MSNDATYPGPQVQIISADEPVGRGRRRWNADDKLRIVEVALEGGAVAITGDDSVTSDKTVRELQSQIKELERQLGRKTMEVEILREAVEQSRLKKQTLRVLSLPRERGQ